MKKTLLAILIIFSSTAAFSLPVTAETQSLGTCLVDSLTGKERKQLAKWIYFAIAVHPEMESFSKIEKTDRESADKFVGILITRLLTEDCSQEFKVAQKNDPTALQTAFGLVGQVAMQELMNDQSVVAALSSYVSYTDQNRIYATLEQQ